MAGLMNFRDCPAGGPFVEWTAPGMTALPAYDLSIGGSPTTSQRFTSEFKEEAVRQVVGRGHSVAEVAARLRNSRLALSDAVGGRSPSHCFRSRVDLNVEGDRGDMVARGFHENRSVKTRFASPAAF